jgi:hypothetical protein
MERSIEDWCIELKLENYKITDDGFVNVNGCVNINDKDLYIIPIKLGIVTAYFNCRSNELTSLEGSPIKLGLDFYCGHNELITLKGATEEIVNNFYCSNNKLTSLEGAPKIVGGHFSCRVNKLISLEGGPLIVGGIFKCIDNPIWEEYKKFDNYNQYMRSIKLKELIK